MAFGVLSLAGWLLALYLSYKTCTFLKFYIHGRRTGYPIFISPVFSKNPAWMVLGPALQKQFQLYLPEWIYVRLDIVTHGWEFRRKDELHRRLGKVFVLVTPDECALCVGDPALGSVILQRRKDFLQAPITGRILGIYGSNVLISNGDDWQRQRRIFAPNLNERISKTVWKESCRQAQTMVQYLALHPGNETLSGLRCLAINAIGAAGYGQSNVWRPSIQSLASEWQGARVSYFNTLALLADMFLEAAFLPTMLMNLSFMPSRLQLLGKHRDKMRLYTEQVLEEERRAAQDGSATRSNFLSMLIRFSDAEKSSGATGLSLSDDEISGNLYVFSTAGFDTTANTMSYAVILLAIYPEWQDWLREEIQGLDADVSTWEYEDVFPKCTRTLGLMFETLRLFSPVLHSMRSVSETQQLADTDGPHILLPPMDIFVTGTCMHTRAEIWGPDVLDFKPSRWIDSQGQPVTPAKGAFLPWSGGPRVCPGMKMSQVEFVAAIATLFRSARCEPMALGSEMLQDARKRLRDLLDDSRPKLTLQVRDDTQVTLRWIPLD